MIFFIFKQAIETLFRLIFDRASCKQLIYKPLFLRFLSVTLHFQELFAINGRR